MDSIRCVVCGCGRMGQLHAARLAKDTRAVITGVFDPNSDAVRQLCGRLTDDVEVFSSFQQAVSLDCDLVVVATPTGDHHEHISQCLQRPRHVLAEKPLAQTAEEIDKLIQQSEQSDLVSVLGYQRRFWRTFRFLQKQIADESLGTLKSVTCISCENWESTIAGTWRNDPLQNFGGYLGDAGSHKIDIMLFVAGRDPVKVSAIGNNGGSQVPVVTAINGFLEGDVPFSMTFVGNAGSYYQEMLFHCEAGDWILRGDDVWSAVDNRMQPVDLPPEESGEESIFHPVRGILDVLTEGLSNPSPFRCARPVFDLTTAILQSVESRGTVRPV